MMQSKHLSKAVLISSASIVTLAFVAIAAQTVNWSEVGKNFKDTAVTEQVELTEADQETAPPQETLLDAIVPTPQPVQPAPDRNRANAKTSGGGLLSLHSSVPSSAGQSRIMELTCTSEKQKGTAFVLTLPLA